MQPTEIYPYCHTLPLPDALPIETAPAGGIPFDRPGRRRFGMAVRLQQNITHRHSLLLFNVSVHPRCISGVDVPRPRPQRASRASTKSEEHTSELQSLMRISYAVFCLKKKKHKYNDK